MTDPDCQGQDLTPLFEAIIKSIPAPVCYLEAPLQFLVTNLDYSDYVGRIAVGKIVGGHLRARQEVALLKGGVMTGKAILSQVYSYEGLSRVERDLSKPEILPQWPGWMMFLSAIPWVIPMILGPCRSSR